MRHHRGSRRSLSRFASANFCPEAGLSEEQKEQIKNLSQERDKQNLSREERRTAREELQKKILEEVASTEDEKTALSKCFEQRKEHNRRDRKPPQEVNRLESKQFFYKNQNLTLQTRKCLNKARPHKIKCRIRKPKTHSTPPVPKP